MKLFSNTSARLLGFTAIIALAVLVVSVFLSSGSILPAYGDEWPIIAGTDNGLPIISQGATRNFLYIPLHIAYLLSPDSFAGYNFYQIVMILLRGILVYILFRLLRPENPSLALVIAALAIFYPGDVASYILSNIHYMTAIVLYLLALIMLVKYWQHPHVGWLLIMGLAQTLCLGMYEGSLPVMLFSPLILVYLQRGITRRVFRVAAYCYVVPILFMIRVVILTSGGRGLEYQTSMINPDNSLPALISGVVEVLGREFGSIWLWAELAMPQGFSDIRTWVVLSVTFIFGCVLWIHQRADQDKVSLRHDLLFIVAGITVLVLGYAPFVITSYRYSFFRTILFGLSGAAIALAVAVWLAVRMPFLFRLILTSIFLFWGLSLLTQTDRLSALLIAIIGIGFLLPRNKRYLVIGTGIVGYAVAFSIGFRANQPYSDLPARQQQLVTAIVQQAPAIKSHTLVLLTGAPESREQFSTTQDRYDIFQGMLQFIYQKYDIEAQFCIPKSSEWGQYKTWCELRANEVVIGVNAGSPETWPYERIIAFDYQSKNVVVLLDHIPSEWMTEAGGEKYNPNALIDHSAPLPYRLQTVWSYHSPN